MRYTSPSDGPEAAAVIDFKPITAAEGITGVANKMAATGLVTKAGEIASMAIGSRSGLA